MSFKLSDVGSVVLGAAAGSFLPNSKIKRGLNRGFIAAGSYFDPAPTPGATPTPGNSVKRNFGRLLKSFST